MAFLPAKAALSCIAKVSAWWQRRRIMTFGGVRRDGIWKFTCRNKDGSIAWEETIHNGNTTVGLTYMAGVAFNSTTPITSWYLLLVDNAAFSAFNASDTAAAHAGWTENTDYDEATRPQWTPLSVTAGVVTNTASVDFTINNTVTIKGGALISNSTKGGTTGTLVATAAFPSTQALTAGQTLQVTCNYPFT